MSVSALKQAQRSLGEVERDHAALAGNVARREEELVAQRERIVQLTALAKQLLDQLMDKEHGGELAALARVRAPLVALRARFPHCDASRRVRDAGVGETGRRRCRTLSRTL